jgi:putative RNA 2'-phosphotransferase
MNLERDDIVDMLAAMESDRFEIRGSGIRGVYGHSISLEKPPAITEPPEFLFHSTDGALISEIMTKGLLCMRRQFVHLSSDMNWVVRFLANKPYSVILRTLACQARHHGVCFRQANSHVWLAKSIPPQFLCIESAVLISPEI